eukprot:16429913-Heterocapsa_arctica.AAC.1
MRHWAAKLSPCCAKDRSATPSRPPPEPPARRSCPHGAEPALGASVGPSPGHPGRQRPVACVVGSARLPSARRCRSSSSGVPGAGSPAASARAPWPGAAWTGTR